MLNSHASLTAERQDLLHDLSKARQIAINAEADVASLKEKVERLRNKVSVAYWRGYEEGRIYYTDGEGELQISPVQQRAGEIEVAALLGADDELHNEQSG